MLHSKTISVTHALSVQVMPDKRHQFIMSTNEVAHGYDCGTSTIRDCLRRNKEEFQEGKHYFSSVKNLDAGNLQTKQTFWTKRGVVRLGFFLKTGRAKLFRDWAEDLIVSGRSGITLRDDEAQLLAYISKYLVKGDQVTIAKELGVGYRSVSAVKCGRIRSKRIMAALVDRAMYNRRSGKQLVIGYDPDYVRTALVKLSDHDQD